MPLRDTTDRPMQTRPCAVAGKFYPSDPVALRRDLDQYLQAGRVDPKPVDLGVSESVRAIIAPHAGYIYSAPIAGSAYRCVAGLKGKVRRVVLMGPAHYVPFSGLGISSADAFETPLGDVRVDTDSVHKLIDAKLVLVHDGAHTPEHGLEVHLPFLVQTLVEDADPGVGISIIPMLFGDVSYEQTTEVLNQFFDDPDTLIVISSDLSHYHEYETARRLDRETADAILAGRGDLISSTRACGHTAIRGLLDCVEQRNLNVTELDLRNSGDTSGPHDRVVGYGAFVIH